MKLLDCLLVGGVGAMLLATAATAEKAAPEQGVVKNPKQEMLCRRETETGSLVPRDDPDALTAALAHWLDDDAARQAAGSKARAHVQANHAIEGEARAIVEVYRKLLA